jgi:hypothetical protein
MRELHPLLSLCDMVPLISQYSITDEHQNISLTRVERKHVVRKLFYEDFWKE